MTRKRQGIIRGPDGEPLYTRPGTTVAKAHEISTALLNNASDSAKKVALIVNPYLAEEWAATEKPYPHDRPPTDYDDSDDVDDRAPLYPTDDEDDDEPVLSKPLPVTKLPADLNERDKINRANKYTNTTSAWQDYLRQSGMGGKGVSAARYDQITPAGYQTGSQLNPAQQGGGGPAPGMQVGVGMDFAPHGIVLDQMSAPRLYGGRPRSIGNWYGSQYAQAAALRG